MAQERKEVQEWFKEYREVFAKYKFNRKDIWVVQKGKIYVPLDIKEASYYKYTYRQRVLVIYVDYTLVAHIWIIYS